MKLKGINEAWINIDGTSYQGDLVTTRRELDRVFGKQEFYAGDKVNFEWVLAFEDDQGETLVGTIYDYKNYDYILGEDEVYSWHLGGHDKSISYEILNAFIQRGGIVHEIPNAGGKKTWTPFGYHYAS